MIKRLHLQKTAWKENLRARPIWDGRNGNSGSAKTVGMARWIVNPQRQEGTPTAVPKWVGGREI